MQGGTGKHTIRTIKSQLVECGNLWPKRVTSLEQVSLAFEKRVTFYNNEFRPQRAWVTTTALLRPVLDAGSHLAPPLILAHPNHDVNHKAILDFKHRAKDKPSTFGKTLFISLAVHAIVLNALMRTSRHNQSTSRRTWISFNKSSTNCTKTNKN